MGIYLHVVCVPCISLVSKEARKGIRSPETGIIMIELYYGYWKLNPDPLQEQQVFLPLSNLSRLSV